MSEPLNQADVDALMGAFPDRNDVGDESPRRDASGTYDFSHPDLLSRDLIRSMRTLHEGYGQALAKRLSTELLANVSVTVSGVDQLTYAEFLMLLSEPTVLSVIEVRDLGGNIAIELDPNLSLAFIDRLLGGVGSPLKELRPLTTIEQGLVTSVLRRCCRELERSWAPITTLQFELQSIETNPEIARVVESNEMVALVRFEMKMNDVTGAMNVCLPCIVMEPAFQQMAHGTRFPRAAGGDPEQERNGLASSVRSCDVGVEVDLGATELTLREILHLAPGDLLRFNPSAECGACANVAGTPHLSGTPGHFRGRLAFEVRDTISARKDEKGGKHGRAN